MKKIRISLYNANVNVSKNTIYDELIKFWQYLFTSNKYYIYTHCELVIDGVFYGSTPVDGGVRKKNVNGNQSHWNYIDFMVTEDEHVKLKTYVNSMLGVKYGWYGIFLSQFLPLHLEDKDRVYCAEFIVDCLNSTGIIDFNNYSSMYDVEDLVNEVMNKLPHAVITNFKNINIADSDVKNGFLKYFKKKG